MGRKKWYESVDQMQKDLDDYLLKYNTQRAHQGYGMNGRTPKKAFVDGISKSDNIKEQKELKKAA